MRQFASKLKELHRSKPSTSSKSPRGIRVVCISDTHNTRPVLPPGDVLIHAGDLTENGSFDEMQAELRWLSDQPYRYKILIAGNHDVLLDEAFLKKHPERRYGQEKTKEDLDWGSVTYLQESVAVLDIPLPGSVSPGENADVQRSRQIRVFGSPWTPQYGISAFQYRPEDGTRWSDISATLKSHKPDIIVTHGPPKHHLDARDFHRAGCPYLAADLIAQIRPRLVVFGHIHASYGQEEVVLDNVQKIYEDAMTGWAGWGKIAWMAILVLWTKAVDVLAQGVSAKRRNLGTKFVNASMVGGPRNELINEPIVVEL